MKITKSQLKRVIKEELQVVLKEGAVPCEPDHNYVKVELFPDKKDDTIGRFFIDACIDGVQKQFTSEGYKQFAITNWYAKDDARSWLERLGLVPKGGIETVAIEVYYPGRPIMQHQPDEKGSGPSYTL